MTQREPAIWEGRIQFRGYDVWYEVAGEGEAPGKLPLLCLHGGPGAPHDYLEPLRALAATGRRVIFYDQVGCGNSDPIRDPHELSTELFVEEVGAVRDQLGLERVHILGQSWGGMLAMQYALTQPSGLASLVVADSPGSIPQWMGELAELRAQLRPDVEAVLRRHEEAGTTDSPEYEEAVQVFYRRHVCRLDPWPEPLTRAFEKLAANPTVYMAMNGPSEFHVIGKIRDWDVTPRLGEIRVPTLLVSGAYDEVTPATVRTVHEGVPGSEWLLFEHSSHTPHLEEPERFLRATTEFLERVESAS